MAVHRYIYPEVDSRPKRTMRFLKKKKKWKYPELHKDHPRLQDGFTGGLTEDYSVAFKEKLSIRRRQRET